MRYATLYRYSLPLDSGVILRDRRLKTRDGLLIHLREGEREGWGEVAPLPGFSQETLKQAQEESQSLLSRWLQADPVSPDLPSVAFGFSCALAELSGELPWTANYRQVPLCHGDPDELFARLNALPGKPVAKVKVGLYEAVRDGLVVNMLLEALPELTLRLDANRSWTRSKADDFARYVPPPLRSRIDFLEEPCHTPEESLAFSRDTGIAIAWDESVREAGFRVQAKAGVSAIVIKPSLTGSLPYCRELISQAHQQGLTAVISASLESSLGLTQLARIADWLTPDCVPGLDTLSLMQAQLIRAWPDSPLPLWDPTMLQLLWQS